jgi:Xaa-Pro aminopeptidase
MQQLLLLTANEAAVRCGKLQTLMREKGITGLLINDNANLYYLCGRVYSGFAYLPVEGRAVWFVRRPVELTGDDVEYIRKPEDIPAKLAERGIDFRGTTGIEFDIAPYSLASRLMGVFEGNEFANANDLLRTARSVKTNAEIALLRESGIKHEKVYRQVPKLYKPGMTDHQFQIEIERLSRLEGCLGLFRISGQSMELFMGNILTGNNADEPTPYDFAMGGAGLDASLPVGASGEAIKENSTVMVDLNGDFNGYMTDMTRVFSVGEISDLAKQAHQCSRDICRMFEAEALPGVEAKALFQKADEMVKSRGLEKYYMGHRQHAAFIGHGLGIEINEMPVIAPRSKSLLEPGNIIALEPKFVIPGEGAVGIENTYLITENGAVSLTNAPEEILPLGL